MENKLSGFAWKKEGGAGSAAGSDYTFLSCYELYTGWLFTRATTAFYSMWKISPTGCGNC